MRPKGSLCSAITSSHLPEELSRNLNTNGFKLEWNYHVASSPNRQARTTLHCRTILFIK